MEIDTTTAIVLFCLPSLIALTVGSLIAYRKVRRDCRMLTISQQERDNYVAAAEKIARDRAQYVRYLQTRLQRHGIDYKQELEWLEDNDVQRFNDIIERRHGI